VISGFSPDAARVPLSKAGTVKVFLRLVGAAAVLSLVGLCAAAWWLLRVPDPDRSLASAGTHRPAYFGFVGVRCGLDDPRDESTRTDYVDEVVGFTNLAHVCVFAQDIRPSLEDLPEAGIKGLVDLTLLLFEFVNGDAPSGSDQVLALRADAAQQWRTFVKINHSVLDSAHVAAYYLADEPTWNGASRADIEAAAAMVSDTSSNIPILIVEPPGVLSEAVFPPTVDWVGFDQYAVTNPAADPSYLENLDSLRRHKLPDQRIAMIMDAQWLKVFEHLKITPADMEIAARNYFALASRSPDVVALIGYTWPGGIDEGQYGARDLPDAVVDAYREIGHRILGRT
jgi:hypothetical protein